MENIHINSMTNIYSKLISQKSTDQNSSDRSFANVLAAQAKKQSVNTKGKITTISPVDTQDLTLDQYKQYIHSELSSMKLHPTQSKYSYSIFISDEAFQAMKEDPEYESFILQTVKATLNFRDPWQSEAYIIMQFGTTKEATKVTSLSAPNKALQQKNEESFWELRAQKKKKQQELSEKICDKKRLQYKIREQAVLEKRALRQMQLNGIYGQEPQMPHIVIPTDAALFLESLGGK